MSDIEVGIIMGSRSDWGVMQEAATVLDALGIGYEAKVVSAHLKPDRLYAYPRNARTQGLKVNISACRSAATLPGLASAIPHLCSIGFFFFAPPLFLFFCSYFLLRDD